jgi:hypothetical protein
LGPGSGMAVMFLLTSLLGALTGVWGLLSPTIRGVDAEPESDPGVVPGSVDVILQE